MSLPGNGIFVVQGEMAMLVTAMRRSTRWGSHSFPNEEYDVLMRTFQDLKTILNQVEDLRLLDPPTYLSPFLEVIRSKETTGPVTSLALSAIHKFLSYGLIDPTHPSVPATVEDIADAVTHARFVGTDHSSDGVVLMKILQVLRTLMLSPEGAMLTDESVCEIMLSCFRICFETRLTELLRRNAEQCLRDMTQLIFMRLPQFPPEDAGAHFATLSLSLKKRDKSTKKKSMSTAHSTNSLDRKSSLTDRATSPTVENIDNDSKVDATHRQNQDKNLMNEAEITIEPVEQQVKSPSKKHARHSSMDLAHGNPSISQLLEKCVSNTDTQDSQLEDDSKCELAEETKDDLPQAEEEEVKDETQKDVEEKLEEYVNHRGIRFTPQEETPNLQPYGLVCVRELFRFVISLCNPLEGQNTSAMVQLGLALVGTALEVAADQLPRYPALLHLVRDPLCRNLLSILKLCVIVFVSLGRSVCVRGHAGWAGHVRGSYDARAPPRPPPPPASHTDNPPPAIYDGTQQILYWSDSTDEIAFVVPSGNEILETEEKPSQSDSLKSYVDGPCASTWTVEGSLTKGFIRKASPPSSIEGRQRICNYECLWTAVPFAISANSCGCLLLLDTERITIFALDLQVSFLLFESLRYHLKFQMEAFFKKIIEIISADTSKSIYELKEIHHLALESLAQMFRIPGFCAELYLNYDCDIYCMNVFEEITKLLSKNVVSSTAYNIHSLSLEALMTIIEAIEMGTSQKMEKSEIEIVEEEKGVEVFGRGGQVSLELGGMDDVSVVSDHVTHDISQYVTSARIARHKPTGKLPTEAELDNIKNMKKWVTQGTELFNQKPERGVEFLQEHGVLATPLDPHQVALFLRENPDLDKKMIGEYICKRSSRGEEGSGVGEGVSGGVSVLSAFADSFDYRGQRIDIALRQYLETFRLPGEAPLIFLVMEKFAERWHTTNGSPFANTDAAFRLAYAIIMLNMDQHNHNAKKLNVPMTAEDFVRNLRGCNGTGDFDQPMLEAIFNSIKNEEMVMPAERVGLVREAYLWRVLQRRARGPAAAYRAPPLPHHHARLLPLLCPPAISALSAAYERAPQPSAEEVGGAGAGGGRGECVSLAALGGLERVAALLARLQPDTVPLDTLLLTLCKFSGLLAPPHAGYIAIGVSLGQSIKAQLALRRACAVAARHADCVRDAWRHLLEILQTLYIGRLLPKCLVEAEDYLAPGGTVSLIRDTARGSDSGLLSSIYSYIALGETVAARHADCVRDAWRHLLEILQTLYIGRLLPKCLVEAEDYLAPGGTVSLIRDTARGSDSGLLSSIYSYIALGETGMRAPTPHEKALIDVATDCVAKCNFPGLLITETKFLQLESLQELVRAMVTAGTPPDPESLQLNPHLEDITIFFLELLGKTLIQNRDRLASVWGEASAHVERVVWWASARGAQPLTRALTALLRTSARLMRCELCAPAVLHHLALLFHLPYKLFYQQADVISCGLYELVKTSAQNVHSGEEWGVLLALLAAAGAGAWPQTSRTRPDGDRWPPAAGSSSRSEASDEETEKRPTSVSSESELSHSPHTQGWIVVKKEASAEGAREAAAGGGLWNAEVEGVVLRAHRASALARCAEALALVVRDVAHVTPHNCRAAGPRGGGEGEGGARRGRGRRKGGDSSDEELDTLDQYHMVSIQLLDLMHTLHSRTAQIFKWWREEADQGHGGEDYDLWEVAWKPLLQGIAEFCTDRRRQVANSAIAYLQRALLAPALGALGGAGWAACFEHVLLPLLDAPPPRPDAAARADTVMCKVFLQHLQALSARAGFGALWARVLGVQRALLATPHEPLQEAALESLKNMLLVMHSVRIFNTGDNYNELWYLTWQIIAEFLPTLKDELFPEVNDNTRPATNLPSHMQPPLPPTLPTLVPVPAPALLPADTPTHTSRPLNVQTSHAQSPNILVASMAHSPVNLIQSPPMATPSLVAPTPINVSAPAPTAVGTVPTAVSAAPPAVPAVGSAAPPCAPLGGLVPIRNPLYDQTGLTSSVLLQPLNEMISTPIGISIQTQPPVLYPRSADPAPPQPSANQNEPYTIAIESTMTDTDDVSKPISDTQQSELYAEYLSNPYNEANEITVKDFNPEENRYLPGSKDQDLLQPKPYETAPAQQKSFSANTTPSHSGNLAQFLSTENLRKESNSIFNFSNYFGSGNDLTNPGSDLFDTLTAAQEG
ncbi:Golgi-specific brefeldin A-resistance guanine nucleotide exchange factor 1 [Papilio machaon]|uniref:Golgi-specific brefeldin A-resistance guanine nucleotide exchange factor 1 n=1 Tax=Papilio machaon TaxID=76193 RepID=A0A194R5A3_PAPMA|nr:Golgi-specific brefeldin A-resistance guanine nucleotide exchange factor 1 [Papilio machaon]